ncbi:class F sortase [Luteipulveratus halotolerans]|uniref:class F sortase n=1 Tax=Luteipulveratus halotolerans TaxID=1631356 RepID=UPI0008FBDBC0|nr:class F sortase [Luteipulveratus halotolerans]
MSRKPGRGRLRTGSAAAAVIALSGAGLVAYAGTQQDTATPPSPGRSAVASQSPSAATQSARPSASSARSGAAYSRPVGTVLAASRPTRVRIPSLKVSTPMIDLGLQPNGRMEVPQNGRDAGWFTDSPTPGELGPSIVAAHVTWQNRRGVFFELGAMKPGQRVVVDRADGSAATFQVDQVGQYPKAAFPTDKVYGTVDRAELRLITCGGVYDGDAGHHLDNVVVFAHLVSASSPR